MNVLTCTDALRLLGTGGGKTHATLEAGAAQGAASGAAHLAPAPQAHSTSSTTCSEQSCQSRPCTALSPARPRRGWRDAGGRPERRGAPALRRWGKTRCGGEPVEARERVIIAGQSCGG